MPEHEVRIPFRDSSWLYGDGAFDMTRSFGGKPFKLKEHMERFYRSLKYLRIDPGMSAEKIIAISEDVFERNRHLLGPDEDYWIGQRVSRGVKEVQGDNLDHGPNVCFVPSAPLSSIVTRIPFPPSVFHAATLAPPCLGRLTVNRRAGELTVSFGDDNNLAAQFTRSVPDFVLRGRFADLVKLDLNALEEEMGFATGVARAWWRRLLLR